VTEINSLLRYKHADSWTCEPKPKSNLVHFSLKIQPFQTVSGDIFVWSVGPKPRVNRPVTLYFRNPITYLLTYLQSHLDAHNLLKAN